MTGESDNIGPFHKQSFSLGFNQSCAKQRSLEKTVPHGFAIVIDIGKTMSKVSLWSRDGQLVDRLTRANAVVEADGLRRCDVNGITRFLLDAMTHLGAPEVRFIIPVAHGAGVAAVDGEELVTLPLDYEQDLPPDVLARYRQRRDPFAVSGSPALPHGLNMGAQLHLLDERYPQQMERATLLPWAQYWAWWLTGEARTEVTSLGCHSDLWAPASGCFSPLAETAGWSHRFAPMAFAGEVIGTLRQAIATQTGLSPHVQILAGLHDSNAALLAARGFAEMGNREATVLSTGTWFVAMRMAADELNLASLPEARDCLVNVDPLGRPVPSARFMGGREIEIVTHATTRSMNSEPDQPALLAAVDGIVGDGAMVLPTLVPATGPYPDRAGGWIDRPADRPAMTAAAHLYGALVADTALDLVGARECLLIEGRFAQVTVFARAVAALRPMMQVFTAGTDADVSFGALRLIDPHLVPGGGLVPVVPLHADLGSYRATWRDRIAATPSQAR